MPLPSEDIRTNRGTWAVPTQALPQVGNFMRDALPNEPFDPHFDGQALATTYFDNPAYDLRKARRSKSRYLTLRVRCYDNGDTETYALSAKTESEKWRTEIEPASADALLAGTAPIAPLLPGHLRARLTELGVTELVPVVTVCRRRYAVEDDQERLTLDVSVHTDRARRLTFAVLEYKSTDPAAAPPGRLPRLGLRPIKLSKFLWATEV